MRELLVYLASNGFANYIVSGGGRDFMRPVTQELCGISPGRVVDTTVALEYKFENSVANVHHTPKLEIFDDGPAKVVHIWSRIGPRADLRRGQLERRHRDDRVRHRGKTAGARPAGESRRRYGDIAYTSGAEKAMAAAVARNWAIAKVKSDWSTVFAD